MEVFFRPMLLPWQMISRDKLVWMARMPENRDKMEVLNSVKLKLRAGSQDIHFENAFPG